MRIAQTRFSIENMRRSVLYAALTLYVFGISATAGERFGQWSVESQGEGTFALAFKRSIPMQDGSGPGLAFICNQESKYAVGILAPSPGTFKSEQESIPLAIQKSEDGYDPSDLLQRWENEGEYIFSEIPDEQEDLTSYLKVREAEGFKSVHFYFPNDLDATTPTTNHVVIDLPGFSSGLETFKKKCEGAQ
jgi:hypothetical protein